VALWNPLAGPVPACAAPVRPKSVALGGGALALLGAGAAAGVGVGAGCGRAAAAAVAAAAALAGCGDAGADAAAPCAVPHHGQNFTGRGIGRAQAGLMQR
jgi:hypothetical protein